MTKYVLKVMQKIRDICTYHGDEGTSGYLLSEEQFNQIEKLFKQDKPLNQKKVYESWWYISDKGYEIDVTMGKVGECWLEAGLPGEHDIRLDTGAKTFEEAVIKLADKLKKLPSDKHLEQEEDLL